MTETRRSKRVATAQKGETQTVTIDKLVYGGDGLARVDGQVLLAPFVLPGEQVTVETTHEKASLLRGHHPTIVEPSPHRVLPGCEYFGKCGGCQYQHANYDYQVLQKVEILRETLRRLGGIEYPDEIPVLVAEPWHYRNRIQLHFAQGKVGYREAGSHRLQPVDHCPIAHPLLVEALKQLARAAREPRWPAFLDSLELFTNGDDLQLNVISSARPLAAHFFEWCATFLPNLQPGAIEYNAAGARFRISGGSFFQVNRFLVDRLVDEVLQDATGDTAIDLYAGVGLFTLPLLARFAQVHAVERGKSAFVDLVANLGENHAATAHRAATEYFLEEFASTDKQAGLVIADPPRAGLGAQAVKALLRLAPRRFTIVSCDPATLARDARHLLVAYRIRRLTLIDLFPQTYHFETVMHLERVSAL